MLLEPPAIIVIDRRVVESLPCLLHEPSDGTGWLYATRCCCREHIPLLCRRLDGSSASAVAIRGRLQELTWVKFIYLVQHNTVMMAAGLPTAIEGWLERWMEGSEAAIEPSGCLCEGCSTREFGICSLLDACQLREFRRRVHFDDCVTIFSEEEISTSFINVLEGVMRLYKMLSDGRRQIVGFALPGDFLGMNGSNRHKFSADAIGAVTVCQFSSATFGYFIEDKPHLLRRINELVIRELSQARDHMVLLGRRSAEEKIAAFLLGWRHRLVPLHGVTDMVPLPMSRRDIGDYLGLTIETVSRTFTKLERDGIIDIIHGGVKLVDLRRVEVLATT